MLAIAQSPPADAQTGKGMFRIYCSACHGIAAKGGRGPDLTRTTRSDEDLIGIITKGSPLTEMPGYSDSLGDANIRRVLTYIRSIAQPQEAPVTGDLATGEKLFWGKTNCGTCHHVGTRGGRLGPDLSLVGRTRSVQHLREAITDPGRDIAPGFATVEVITKEGRVIRGVERGFGNFSAQLMDSSEVYHSFDTNDVQALRREKKSMMPAYRLPDAELNHLIVYLQSLGRKP